MVSKQEKICSVESVSESSEKTNLTEKLKSHRKCIPWILLTLGIGLCIIAFGIYIILRLNSRDNNGLLEKELEIVASQSREVEDDGSFELKIGNFGKVSNDLELPQNIKGCSEISCYIDCYTNENLYSDIAGVMDASKCEVIPVMMIANQDTERIEDLWIDSNKSVLKLVLMNSKIGKISTGAFSASMFSKVFHMHWASLQLSELSNGALLGLYSLKKLEIDFRLPVISMTFLQPVQVTLTHLRINSGISFKGNLNAFENIYLGKLYHLDLSHNSFSGPLSKVIFSGTPNITYLYLKSCHITAIEDTAFEDIAEKLVLIDLKYNSLTHIGDLVFGMGNKRILLDLEPNHWNCDCHLRSLVDYFNENKYLFISTPYCRFPFNLYGKAFDELDPQELLCESTVSRPIDTTISLVSVPTNTTDPLNGQGRDDEQEILGDDTYSWQDSTEAPTKPSPHGAILQFSCSEALDFDMSSSQKTMAADETIAYSSGTFVFEPPIYDLVLDLFENYSVRAYIDGYQSSEQLNIIWFSGELESDSVRNASQTDYTCMQYEEPALIVDPLQQNHTYTFCMMPMDMLVISPLYCQPLHVPAARNTSDLDDIWIAESEKQFTIAMLCLIFFISTVFGAIFAYLGIKAFPNLLEGSKNVLVVKELDKECRVSTIADSKYIKTPPSKNSLKLRHKKSLEAAPRIYDTNVPSLVGIGSPSTLLDQPFANMEFQTIGYEMPKQFKMEANHPVSTISKCVDRPRSPPPLPKRNSTVSDIMDSKLKV